MKYFIGVARDNWGEYVHVTDSVDCLPADVRDLHQASSKTLAAAMAISMVETIRLQGKQCGISVNVTEGIFETRKDVRQWAKG